jgi:hypothetical protein
MVNLCPRWGNYRFDQARHDAATNPESKPEEQQMLTYPGMRSKEPTYDER